MAIYSLSYKEQKCDHMGTSQFHSVQRPPVSQQTQITVGKKIIFWAKFLKQQTRTLEYALVQFVVYNEENI